MSGESMRIDCGARKSLLRVSRISTYATKSVCGATCASLRSSRLKGVAHYPEYLTVLREGLPLPDEIKNGRAQLWDFCISWLTRSVILGLRRSPDDPLSIKHHPPRSPG